MAAVFLGCKLSPKNTKCLKRGGVTNFIEIFTRKYGESKNSVIFSGFLKSEVNLATACRAYTLVSRAIDRVFKEIRRNLSIFNPSYLSCKGLLSQDLFIQGKNTLIFLKNTLSFIIN